MEDAIFTFPKFHLLMHLFYSSVQKTLLYTYYAPVSEQPLQSKSPSGLPKHVNSWTVQCDQDPDIRHGPNVMRACDNQAFIKVELADGCKEYF